MRRTMVGRGTLLAALATLGTLAVAPATAQVLAPLAGTGDTLPAAWQFRGLPQQQLARTAYSVVRQDGAAVLRIDARASYGNLVHTLPAGSSAQRLAWRWRVEQPNPQADLRTKAGDDNAVKLCLLFDLPLDAVPFVERQLLRLARSRSAELLPAATLCYTWDARLPAGTLLDNPYSRRVRSIVLRGAETAPGRWQAEARDVAADFLRAFGDEARTLPPLLAVAVAGDADNTGGTSLAFVADLVLE